MIYKWDIIQKLAQNNVGSLIFNSELSFNAQISFIADKIVQDPECCLVLVVGPSSSGKTTFTRLLSKRLEYLGVKAHDISTDDFFIDREKVPVLKNGLKDYDSLSAIDVKSIQKCVKSILNGEWFETPTYDFLTGKSIPNANLHKLHKEDVVILEGIHAFNPVFLENSYDERVLRVYIAPQSSFDFGDGLRLEPDELRLLRRTIRDYVTRNYTFEATIKQWKEVRRAEEIFIKPYLDKADYRVDSVYAYELLAYKHCIYQNLKNSTELGYEKIIAALDRVPFITLSTIPEESLLNEFVHVIK